MNQHMSFQKLKGLFINCAKAQCSIYESGKMVYGCLQNSELFLLDYIEIDAENRQISAEYDFYLFNYHLVTMSWLETNQLKTILPGVKMTIVLEVSPNDPFVYCSPKDFNAYIVLDPTLKINQENVFAFPRPLEAAEHLPPYEQKDVPIIGSFGFATKGKGFEHVVDAVNREFERAVVRINIPFATFADETHELAKQLAEMCRNRAKSGVEVVVTHEFMSKPDLIGWCAQNTLNCFLYDRNMPGLAATTDQAISSGRPLSISKNNTFRHVQQYIKPFPYLTLRESIETTAENVREIQREWSPEKFGKRFDEVIKSLKINSNEKSAKTIELPIKTEAERRSLSQRIYRRLKQWAKSANVMGAKGEAKNSYSQFGEDKIIYNLLTEMGVQNISYLDIGANNPKYISNTALFYEKGFNGVLIEPTVFLFEKLKAARPRDVVLNIGVGIDDTKEADFYLFSKEADGLSTFSDEEAKHWETVGMGGRKFKVEKIVKMPLVKINDVIRDNFTECPDFVSIDVEGWDLKILKTLDFERYSPAVFCVETLMYKPDGSTYRNQEIYDFLASENYLSFHETYANTIFVNKNLYEFHLFQKEQLKKTEQN